MAEIAAFDFRQCSVLLKATGRKARSLRDLRDGIATVRDESIFHHTYQYFLKGHIREYTNDFTHWIGEALEERALAERLSSIDPYEFSDTAGLRRRLLAVIDEHGAGFPEPRPAMAGDEFHFSESVTILFPVGVRVTNLAEFLMALKYVDAASIYYHFYEARTRLGGGVNDFSRWIGESLGKTGLAERIQAIDAFMHSLEGIREHIADAVEDEVKRDMEQAGVRS